MVMKQRLTNQQIDQLKLRLLAKRSELSRLADEEIQTSRQQPYQKLAGDVHDKGDEAIAVQVTGLQAELADRHTVELHNVEAALQRIADGSYGICIDCESDIDYQRLQAYPMAKRCIECTRKYESEHGRPHSPSL